MYVGYETDARMDGRFFRQRAFLPATGTDCIIISLEDTAGHDRIFS